MDQAATEPTGCFVVPNDADTVVEARNLAKRFPSGVDAVRGINLRIGRGEFFGLLGPNGAGKSTTVGMLTSMVTPTGGSAFIEGVDVAAEPAAAKAHLGVVPQTNTLDRSLTVLENLVFHGRYFGMAKKAARSEAERLLEQFRLEERSGAQVAALSGGMAQRLMAARAIMHRPSVLFLDEPTAGLDPQSRIALWEIIQELHHAGQTVVLTTHYMEEAEDLCDRVAIIDQGRIIALDSPDALKASLGAARFAVVSVAGNAGEFAAAAQRDLNIVLDATVESDTRVRMSLKTGTGVLAQLLGVAETVGTTVTDYSISEPTLETVFISLTGKELRE
ncbi:MAG: ABC transporter ATP-binding protein [Acidimicrobiia bacterium]|nr:ABC transporter ATP-binding protein [Acidimicrobiia bacterium]MBP8181174.1 ABC transporter ATP-binding protein [Acidimicrobiia bacterium]